MSFKKPLLTAAMVVALPLLAQAQPVNGPYLGAGIGGNFLQGTDIGGQDFSGTDASVDFSWGYVSVLSLGWGFGNGLRIEVEGSYRRNDASDFSVFSTLPGPKGTATSYGAMANILYDIDIGSALGGVMPYVGIGVGYIQHEYDKIGFSTRGYGVTFSGDAGAFGGQAITGLSIPIATVPGLALTAEYRLMATSGHDIDATGTADENGIKRARPFKLEVDNFNHSLLIGLRYAFNAAPVVAAVAAVPVAQARTFLVFFDWSKADLTDRARQIIGEAAAARSSTGVTRIEVNGFTDRSGPASYNMGLSQRRANAVAAELVRRGVPRNEIVTRGFGEENNLVPTADGVREPQNRRVEIILK